VIGYIFDLFSGMFDIATMKNVQGGYRKIQDVDRNMKQLYEGDEEVPYFEAIYMAYYIYFMVI
jgi:hypothetical protein